jgi:putative hydrolase of the HAD superfamily
VITDWGGVLTNPIVETVETWLAADGIDRASYATVMRKWIQQAYNDSAEVSPIRALERGECSLEEFELALASELVLLDGGPVLAAGLLERMWAGSVLDQAMMDTIAKLHETGVPTALLSNSWGSNYPRELFPGLFDVVVISAEVGMRKPEPRIFQHAAELLRLQPEQCVFIDDIQANIAAAEQLGFTGVLHSDAAATAERLAQLFG